MSKTDQKATDANAVADKATEDQKSAEAKAAEQKAAEDQAAADAKAAEEKAEDTSPEIDVERIKGLIEIVEARQGHSIANLIHRLHMEEGLQEFPTEEGDSGAKKLVMAGVTCRVHTTPDRTLQNWANAARRALLKAG